MKPSGLDLGPAQYQKAPNLGLTQQMLFLLMVLQKQMQLPLHLS